LATSYYEAHPRQADPSTGRTYPYNYHGIVVYQTRNEQRLLDGLFVVPFFLAGAGILISVVKCGEKFARTPRH
jgi:hypothetical protein